MIKNYRSKAGSFFMPWNWQTENVFYSLSLKISSTCL